MEQNNIFSIEPEVAVLSILLRNPQDISDVEGVRFFMMSSTPHQMIFKQIEDLAERNVIPDVAMLLTSLESAGNLTKVGGKEYIENLVSQNFEDANLKEYASIIRASYKARSATQAVTSFKSSEITVENVDSYIGDLRRSLDKVLENSGGSATVHIGDNARKALEEIITRTENPGIRGNPWGIRDIDMSTGGKSVGDLWIIAARPSMGKTAMICNSILEDAKNGVASLLFEKEMNYQTLLERLVAIDTGISLQNIRMGFLKADQIDTIKESIKKIKDYPIYVDTNFSSTVYYLESTVQRYKKLYNISNVYLDYLQLFVERDDNQTHELGRLSRMLKLLSTNYDLCSIAVSQLSRAVELRDNKRPIMSDLRQSGNLEEDADFVVGLYRDDYYNAESKGKGMLEFIVLKARNGPVGSITLNFTPDSNRINKT